MVIKGQLQKVTITEYGYNTNVACFQYREGFAFHLLTTFQAVELADRLQFRLDYDGLIKPHGWEFTPARDLADFRLSRRG